MIEYDGTNYCGWQRQSKNCSVQSVLEEALRPLNGNKNVVVVGSGRTDSGVHALGQVAHFDIDTNLAPERINAALNAETPDDILILRCDETNNDFHSRFSAVRRTYFYQVLLIPSVIHRHYTWYPNFKFDISVIEECAKLIIGEHDFSSFCKASTEAESKICVIYDSLWYKTDQMITYRISGNRFLHSMVRMVVGTMLETSRGKNDIDDFYKKLENSSSKLKTFTAPAKGLFLLKVDYK